MIPKPLAETPRLATTKVRQWLNQTIGEFGPDAKLTRFFDCDPRVNDVSNHHRESWYEASWGADITVSRFSAQGLHRVQQKAERNAVKVDDATILPLNDKTLEVRLWLSARVEKWC